MLLYMQKDSGIEMKGLLKCYVCSFVQNENGSPFVEILADMRGHYFIPLFVKAGMILISTQRGLLKYYVYSYTQKDESGVLVQKIFFDESERTRNTCSRLHFNRIQNMRDTTIVYIPAFYQLIWDVEGLETTL